jgi:phospholipase C
MSHFAFGIRLLLIAALLCFTVVACRGNNGMATPPVLPLVRAYDNQSLQPLAKGKIQHVVIIIQENRSFNNLFYEYPGAKTVKYGHACVEKAPDVAPSTMPGCDKGFKDTKVLLRPVSLATTWDLEHSPKGFIAACNGTGTIKGTDCRMNGFNHETWSCNKPFPVKCPIEYPPYAYVPHEETKPYFEMAQQYVLADEMFASNFDSTSFMSHQFIIAGTNPEKTIGIPQAAAWGCPGGKADTIAVLGLRRVWPKGYIRACWAQLTLGDELTAAGISWSFYATPIGENPAPCGHNGIDGDNSGSSNGGGIWSAYQAIEGICYNKRQWDTHILTPPQRFLNDIGRGKLTGVTWITPTWLNSDHGGSGSKTGPSWVTSLVNAIGESQYWNSTAIFVFWDDYGGWYDPEPPAHLDNAGLGMRLPMLIISPYAKKGFVDRTHYEHGTILKFVENTFGLPRLTSAGSDVRANPPNDAFDFSKPPRKFVKIKAPLNANYFIHERLDGQPPDSD